MLALYLWPPAKLLICLSFSNLLLRFMKGMQTCNIQAHVYYKNKERTGICKVHKNTHTLLCAELSCLSRGTFLSRLISCCVSKRSHERKNFHTFHLLLSSLLLTHSALSSLDCARAICQINWSKRLRMFLDVCLIEFGTAGAFVFFCVCFFCHPQLPAPSPPLSHTPRLVSSPLSFFSLLLSLLYPSPF